jgi:hypothetical protein
MCGKILYLMNHEKTIDEAHKRCVRIHQTNVRNNECRPIPEVPLISCWNCAKNGISGPVVSIQACIQACAQLVVCNQDSTVLDIALVSVRKRLVIPHSKGSNAPPTLLSCYTDTDRCNASLCRSSRSGGSTNGLSVSDDYILLKFTHVRFGSNCT